jgi:excisionase family DNA binding protein
VSAADQLAAAIADVVTQAVTDALAEAVEKVLSDAAPVEPDAVSLATAAARLGVSTRTLHRLAEAGGMRTVRIGSRTVVPVTEIARIVGEDES